MSDNKTKTERLREMLDALGVEYETDDKAGFMETSWRGCTAFQLSPFAKMTMIVTPEQAIAATLEGIEEPDTIRNELTDSGLIDTCAELGNGTCINEWAEFGKFRCSECWTQVDAISTNTTQPMPIRYCPNCGAKVESSETVEWCIARNRHHVKPRTLHDALQSFRESCHKAEAEHGEHSQQYDIAISKAFRDCEREIRKLLGGDAE